MRILVTGKSGQVASAIKAVALQFPDIDIINIGRPEVDLCDPEGLIASIMAQKPDIVVSVAAYTAVDKAETEIDLARQINAIAPEFIAKACKVLDIPLIHLSTDYVYGGDKDAAYIESDPPSPQSIYGLTKLEGERHIIANIDNYVILRTAWVYSPYGHNFVKTMLRLGESKTEINVVGDQFGCPTYALDIAHAILDIAQKLLRSNDPNLRGIFHLTASGEASWAQFASAIFDEATLFGHEPVTVNAISSAQYPLPAKRPANSRLNSDKLAKHYAIRLDDWRVSLKQCISILCHEAR